MIVRQRGHGSLKCARSRGPISRISSDECKTPPELKAVSWIPLAKLLVNKGLISYNQQLPASDLMNVHTISQR